MLTDRRAILHLVALGRITPAEAERLLAAWNEGRESLLALTGCILIACLDCCQARRTLSIRWVRGICSRCTRPNRWLPIC